MIKQNKWDLDDVIPKHFFITDASIRNQDETVEDFVSLLARDVYSEGDSQPLYDYVISRKDEMSTEFLDMMELWLEDELKHYEALRRCYYAISNVSYEQMDKEFEQRVPELEPIQLLLEDEFTILVALMFDELGSTYSYRRDLKEYYSKFGTEVAKVGHHLVKDEGMHFGNAAELLLANHSHRLSEVESLLNTISSLEKSLGKYHKTFFLDHAQEQHRFPPYFNNVLIRVILSKLGLGDKPTQNEVRDLWQWVPIGSKSVPVLA